MIGAVIALGEDHRQALEQRGSQRAAGSVDA
jgi:hypothetical protein